jgi:FKBP-type peptidyl-prolyl cis-trans isomerase
MYRSSIAILAVLCVLLLFTSCSPYPDHKQIAEDTYIRLYSLGEGEVLPQDGDSLLLRIRISEVNGDHGSILSTERWFAVEDLREGAFTHVLQQIHEGDSISFISPSEELPWNALRHEEDTMAAPEGIILRAEIGLRQLLTVAMMEDREKRMKQQDPQRFEQELTRTFVARLGIAWEQWGTSQVFYNIQGIAMDTLPVTAGDIITISYTGKRIEDGSTFDSTEQHGGPMTFRFGDKDQVIHGLEVAISLLREGQEGDFFFPSEYAFGAKGVDQLIEPYTPVLYTVRLEHIQRVKKKSA